MGLRKITAGVATVGLLGLGALGFGTGSALADPGSRPDKPGKSDSPGNSANAPGTRSTPAARPALRSTRPTSSPSRVISSFGAGSVRPSVDTRTTAPQASMAPMSPESLAATTPRTVELLPPRTSLPCVSSTTTVPDILAG